MPYAVISNASDFEGELHISSFSSFRKHARVSSFSSFSMGSAVSAVSDQQYQQYQTSSISSAEGGLPPMQRKSTESSFGKSLDLPKPLSVASRCPQASRQAETSSISSFTVCGPPYYLHSNLQAFFMLLPLVTAKYESRAAAYEKTPR